MRRPQVIFAEGVGGEKAVENQVDLAALPFGAMAFGYPFRGQENGQGVRLVVIREPAVEQQQDVFPRDAELLSLVGAFRRCGGVPESLGIDPERNDRQLRRRGRRPLSRCRPQGLDDRPDRAGRTDDGIPALHRLGDGDRHGAHDLQRRHGVAQAADRIGRLLGEGTFGDQFVDVRVRAEQDGDFVEGVDVVRRQICASGRIGADLPHARPKLFENVRGIRSAVKSLAAGIAAERVQQRAHRDIYPDDPAIRVPVGWNILNGGRCNHLGRVTFNFCVPESARPDITI